MNLHIITDSSISQTFYRNLRALNLLDSNRVVVQSKSRKLKYITENIPFAPLYSSAFRSLIGETSGYNKVFIHLFSPLMYRWIAKQEFRELNWMVWGADLYNLSGINFDFYEAITSKSYLRKSFSKDALLFKLKIWLTNSFFKKRAYSQVTYILTWMEEEYSFAKRHLPSLTAEHRFFFYENSVPYHQLDALINESKIRNTRVIQRLIIGNSGTPTNNHLDIIHRLEESHVKADLVIPVSYGDVNYIQFLKKNIPRYTGGTIEFVDQFMAFEEYVNFCMDADGLIMYNIRPQGYGNILMMLYLGKRVFLNEKNISLPDLKRYGIEITPWSELNTFLQAPFRSASREAISRHLSHTKLEETYLGLFS